MDQLHLITTRRREVEQEIARLKQELAEREGELVELDTAGKVIARLSGAKWPPAGALDAAPKAQPDRALTAKRLTMPKMILAALRQAKAEHKPGLEPKDMTQWISVTYDPSVKGEYVSAIAWRMWKRGQLEKPEDSALYSLPGMNEAGDDLLGEATSPASGSQSQQGREAGPGGGT